MTNPNDPAFSPEAITQEYLDKFPELATLKRVALGLTKREYFAAMAMQGMMTLDPHLLMRMAKGETVCGFVAFNSVSMADALIAELNKEKS